MIIKKNRNLFFLGLASAMLLTIAPIQDIKAGYYQYYDDIDADFDSDMSQPKQYSYRHVDASAEADVSYGSGWAYCSIDASASSGVSNGNSSDAWASGYSWAYAVNGWDWVGQGTPSGGTLYFSYNAYGSISIEGTVEEVLGPYSSAYATSDASSSTGPVSASGSGSVSDLDYASVDGWIYPEEAGTFDPIPFYRWYLGGGEWSFYLEDEEEIPVGTPGIYIEAYPSGDGYASVETSSSSNESAACSSSGMVHANASFSASFVPN